MIQSLTIEAFRNISSANIRLGDSVTVLHGNNGAGKSSFLEALYYLSFGRSFRSHDARMLIKTEAGQFVIRADIKREGVVHTCAVSRSGLKSVAKINGSASPLSHIARVSPTLFADSDTYRNFMMSSTYRRKVFDWLGFHVKPGYLDACRRYSSILKNRNAALKMNQSPSPWDALLVPEAEYVTRLRKEVFDEFVEHFSTGDAVFLDDAGWQFDPGYNVDSGFEAELLSAHAKDRVLRRTTVGPHTADWVFSIQGKKAKDALSQGQQKTAFFYSLAAQDRFMQDLGTVPLLLIDDYAAELDVDNKRLLHSMVFGRAGQSVVTSIHRPDFDAGPDHQLFHVKQGGVVGV